MLTQEENEFLTRVGPGTPCGELMRRYWHPIFPDAKLRENPVQHVRILCEDLTLYRDRSGTLGLIGQRCPHRAVDLRFGIPEQEGLRCPYHGWLYNETGQCTEMPLEPPDSTFKDRIEMQSYPVQELGGLIWAYLGPRPVPLLPRWDLFVHARGFRQIVAHRLPCNWLQVLENRGDHAHAVYLHGRLFQYALEREGKLTDDPLARYNATMTQQYERLDQGVYTKYRPVRNQFGFANESRMSNDEEKETVNRNPVFFPYTLSFTRNRRSIRNSYQIGVPVDDTHTWHMQYMCYDFPPEVDVPDQDYVPYAEVPLTDEKGNYYFDYVLSQDMVAWYAQGETTDRTQEHLATTDVSVIEHRRLLREQIEIVLDGGEPINVFRDPFSNESLEMALYTRPGAERGSGEFANQSSAAGYYRSNFHKISKGGWPYIDDDADRFCPDRDLIIELYRRSEEAWEAKQAEASPAAGD
ncbi:MAG TPA: Rieske 2Fe-2S domain-containing protein [Dehalococcoidia bacterium]|nr:Rieske 2Fe-2S domain-containing protein [Dehalococcoidia bacterium]